MFERTDEDGILYIPWYQGNHKISCRCKMDWNLFDLEQVQKEFSELYSDLADIGKLADKLTADAAEYRRILNSDRLFAVWNIYVKPFDIKENYSVIYEINEKKETIEDIKRISRKIINEESIDDFEQSLLRENIDISVSKEENAIYKSYSEQCFRESEKRIGSNICAYSVIIRAMRLCKLFSWDAPKVIIDREAQYLASAMVIHKYAKSKEEVSDSIRYNYEKLEYMSDEELDSRSKLKKSNTRKSMAPLYVYQILQKYSSPDQHLRQKDILLLLNGYPYEITLERKALSRILHNLLDDPTLFVHSDNSGVWIE